MRQILRLRVRLWRTKCIPLGIDLDNKNSIHYTIDQVRKRKRKQEDVALSATEAQCFMFSQTEQAESPLGENQDGKEKQDSNKEHTEV